MFVVYILFLDFFNLGEIDWWGRVLNDGGRRARVFAEMPVFGTETLSAFATDRAIHGGECLGAHGALLVCLWHCLWHCLFSFFEPTYFFYRMRQWDMQSSCKPMMVRSNHVVRSNCSRNVRTFIFQSVEGAGGGGGPPFASSNRTTGGVGHA